MVRALNKLAANYQARHAPVESNNKKNITPKSSIQNETSKKIESEAGQQIAQGTQPIAVTTQLVGTQAPQPQEISGEPSEALLQEFQNALQYGQPIDEIIHQSPSIVNAKLNNGMLPTHFAIYYGNERAIDLLLDKADLQLKDDKGYDAFDRAVQANYPLAKKIMQRTMEKDWNIVQNICRNTERVAQENPGLKAFLSNYSEEELPKILAFTHMAAQRGYTGHNNVLVRALYNSDLKAFMRAYIDGADVNTLSQANESLLFLAVKMGKIDFIHFLLLKNPQLAQDPSVVELIKAIGNETLSHLIAAMQNPESISDHVKEVIATLTNAVEAYEQEYAIKKTELSEDELKLFSDVAKHGLMNHPEGSQGHNTFVLSSIIKSDLEQLVFWNKMGASINTLSTSFDRANEDPLGYAIYLRQAQEEMQKSISEAKEAIFGEDPAAWDSNLGLGKSLLDMAVLYTKEGDEKLDIIAYLLGQGLDPFRTNDEGECPFSIALVKGNLKAASLMLNYAAYSQGLPPQIDEESLNRTCLMLKEGSKLRDALYVNTPKLTQASFALVFLLTQVYAENKLFSFLNLLPLFISGLVPGISFREKITQKAEAPIYYPDIVKHTYSYFSKASVLEFSVMRGGSPIAGMCLTALSVYGGTINAFRATQEAFGQMTDRPLSAIYKVGMETLPGLSSLARFKSMFSSIFLKPNFCKEFDVEEFVQYDHIEKLNQELDVRCARDIQIAQSVSLLQREAAITKKPYTPDDLRNTLQHVINEQPYTMGWETAIKAGIVLSTSNSYVEQKVPAIRYIWPVLSTGTMVYQMGMGALAATGMVYNAAKGVFGY